MSTISITNPHWHDTGRHSPIKCSWRQPLRVDGPKASQRSIISYEINFCTDQVKTHREVRFWFDLSYDATKVHGQMLRIKFCSFLFVFCRKVLPWDGVYKMARPKTRDTKRTAYCDVGIICAHNTTTRDNVTSAHYGNPLFCLLSLPKVTHYCLAQLVQMAIGIVIDLWYEMWFRDSACKFLLGKSQYFSSYLIIERSEAFNPVTLRGEPGTR